MTTHEFGEQHTHGLHLDLLANEARVLERRRALRLILAGGTTALMAACGGGTSSSDANSTTGSTSGTGATGGSSSGACLADPTETNGPYPSDGSNTVNGAVSNVLTESGIVRSDITGSFGALTGTAPGVPLALTFNLFNSNDNCSVLADYAIYIWHCTRDGLYSLYSAGAQDQNFLRGVQVTDASGQVTFTTIFPGCYSGRYPHIHFEVYPSLAMATNYSNRTLVSQLAMPADICSTIYAGATGYAGSSGNFASISVASDNVFSDNTAAQIAQQTPSLSGSIDAGYSGTILIGVPA